MRVSHARFIWRAQTLNDLPPAKDAIITVESSECVEGNPLFNQARATDWQVAEERFLYTIAWSLDTSFRPLL
jgi:hypothetical protein